MVPLAANIKAILAPLVGTIEIQDNLGFTGPAAAAMRALITRNGWSEGEPYCAYTVSEAVVEAFHKAGVPLPAQIIADGSTSAIALHARAHGHLGPDPATGAIAVMKGGDTGWHHTELVWDVLPDGSLKTFGANTINPNDSTEQGVFFHTRRVDEFDFVTW